MRRGALGVLRPERGRQAVLAVVHQRERFGVVLHLHDADDRAEGLFAHEVHGMIDIDEDLRREIGAAVVLREELRIDQRLGALGNGIGDLRAHDLGETLVRHRPERGFRIERIAELVVRHPGDRLLDEGVVERSRCT